MNAIPLLQLTFAFIPVLITVVIMVYWSISPSKTLYSVARMLIQLMIIGFFLDSIFNSKNHVITLLALSFMLLAASWIALKSLPIKSTKLFYTIFISISFGSLLTLAIMTQAVLDTDPWFDAKVLIPIAGMIFANSMNTISLAGERFFSEINNNDSITARNHAFLVSMMPITNSLFAVGLVSLPGMMTGQILSGVEPLIAVRYQIMVMCMILGSGGISTALFLHLMVQQQKQQQA